MRKLLLLSTLCLLAAFTPSLYASTFGVDFTNTTGESLANGPYTLGWVFTVGRSNITVTDLLVFDDSQNGLAESHDVGIWNSAGTLIVSSTVDSGTTDPLVVGLGSGWRDKAISPTVLLAGQTYTIGALWLDGADNNIFDFDVVNNFTQNGITFVQNGFIAGGTLSDPVNTTGSNPSYFGPNFLWGTSATVPEPASLVMLGTGVLALGLARLRRRTR